MEQSRKHFQLYYENDSVTVDFILESDGLESSIHTIQLNTANGLLDLPINPTFEHVDGKCYLFQNRKDEIKGIETEIRERKENRYVDDIVKRILSIKEAETPRFSR
jgi:hypothetical protein